MFLMLCLLFHHSPESVVNSFLCFADYVLNLILSPETLYYIDLALKDIIDDILLDYPIDRDSFGKKYADPLSGDYNSLKEPDDTKIVPKKKPDTNKIVSDISILVVTIVILDLMVIFADSFKK